MQYFKFFEFQDPTPQEFPDFKTRIVDAFRAEGTKSLICDESKHYLHTARELLEEAKNLGELKNIIMGVGVVEK